MISKLMSSTALAAVIVAAGLVTAAAAQDQGGATTPPPAEAAPPATSPPAAAAPPAAGGTTAPAANEQQKLPEVEVIQSQPKPETVEPDSPPAPKVAKKKPVATPQPAAAQAKPKPKPQPVADPEPVFDPAPVTAATEPPQAAASNGGPPSLDTAVRIAPLSGSEIPLDKVPINVGTASADQISTEGSSQVQQTLQQTVPGIIITDIGGSAFRSDVSYRGFDASSVGGRAQGLAVYQNGVRINEAFGDTVNFDIIPSNAIQDITVISANPVFGLNAIGGAISIVTKDGFTYEGGEVDVMGGSFGRAQVGVQAGGNSGNFSVYAAGQYIEEDGFRDFSKAEVKRFFGDIGYRNSETEIHLSLTAANTTAGVVAASPIELLQDRWSNTFTSPQDTEIEVFMPTLSAKVRATETLTFSGVGYYRSLKQNVIDGNLSEADECSFNDDILCLTDDGVEAPLQTANGSFVDTPDGPIGSIERINTDADSYGVAFQAVEKSHLFSRPNQFLIGVSYDHGDVGYQTSSEVGTIGEKFVVTGTGASSSSRTI